MFFPPSIFSRFVVLAFAIKALVRYNGGFFTSVFSLCVCVCFALYSLQGGRLSHAHANDRGPGLQAGAGRDRLPPPGDYARGHLRAPRRRCVHPGDPILSFVRARV